MLSTAPSPPSAYSDARYLSSKKTVDDRALSRQVLDRLRQELGALGRDVPSVLELGAGLGTMVARLVDWGILTRARYELVDIDRDMLGQAQHWLREWAAQRGFRAESSASELRIRNESATIDLDVRFVAQELGQYLDAEHARAGADLLIANAFLDLVDLERTLPRLLRLVRAEGLYWVTVNYDGDTIFCPEHADDERFMRVYNRSMDDRIRFGGPAGSSKTGRALFGQLRNAGASVLAAGASDWIVYGQNGAYEADERYFLEHILHTIEEELKQHPEVDRASLTAWLAQRRQQIERGELVYIAHQLDFVGRA